MDAALNIIKQTAITADETTRQNLISSLNKLVLSLESPNDTVHRYGHMKLQTSVIRVGFDLGLFKLLAAAKGPLSVREIVHETGAEYQLLHRILRYLAAIDVVDEVAASQFAANNVTKNLTERVVEAGLDHFLNTVGPQYEALPAFLERTKYREPVDELQTPFQDAFRTSLHAFTWFAENPTHLSCFNDYMALRRKPEVSWLTVYPVVQRIAGWDALNSSKAVYVNIGGGIGHQCQEFKAKYPDIPGRVILQDLKHSIMNALPTPGVENMEYDFFERQPVKGAKFYFLRSVLHDHPPNRVNKILKQIKAAMTPESILLVDEIVLPEAGVNVMAASIDMTMLTAMAGKERTEAQWQQAFEDVGLELTETFIYSALNCEGVMEVRLSKDDANLPMLRNNQTRSDGIYTIN